MAFWTVESVAEGAAAAVVAVAEVAAPLAAIPFAAAVVTALNSEAAGTAEAVAPEVSTEAKEAAVADVGCDEAFAASPASTDPGSDDRYLERNKAEETSILVNS